VIVLDTNVLSALMMRGTEFLVDHWLDRQDAESLWTTAITVFEIRFGIDRLASGRQKQQLEAAFARSLEADLQERILDFDRDAAHEAAAMAARRQAIGRPVEFRDLEIAGIVASRRATLATRNMRHFEGLRIELVNPWE
jgi:toxin FitB